MNNILLNLLASLQALSMMLQGHAVAHNAQILPTQTPKIQHQTKSVFVGNQLSEVNKRVSDSVVNILCIGSDKVHGGTASGVIISPDGTILTNAHIAQYLLLDEYSTANVNCTIRTGSPARNKYRAKVIYIPPSWIKQSAYQITHEVQYGTGQEDYALLQITNTIDESQMPAYFHYAKLNAGAQAIRSGNQVLVRTYPAELIGPTTAVRDLHAVSTIDMVHELSSFTDNPEPDLFALGGSIVAQGGSSGGGVFNNNDELIGIIVTTTKAKQTKDRTLRAISLFHINNSLKHHTGISIAQFADLIKPIKLNLYKDLLINQTKILIKALGGK